ncbi:hypothetical protein THRCLA_20351 [Thraustotheca clavata]|uniref:Uncharacterized protein n=1 Tax=Thraustotheca clavata TaxID=74557 RepID=A0A1W0A8J9_9STRA|nr:hypothetical protein THRCLA_20351 [Thraustotheca clavata]
MTQQTFDGVLTQLCRRSCSAVVCVVCTLHAYKLHRLQQTKNVGTIELRHFRTSCTKEFIKVQTQSVLQLNCPICIQPINLVRWKDILGNEYEEIFQFQERIRNACVSLWDCT